MGNPYCVLSWIEAVCLSDRHGRAEGTPREVPCCRKSPQTALSWQNGDITVSPLCDVTVQTLASCQISSDHCPLVVFHSYLPARWTCPVLLVLLLAQNSEVSTVSLSTPCSAPSLAQDRTGQDSLTPCVCVYLVSLSCSCFFTPSPTQLWESHHHSNRPNNKHVNNNNNNNNNKKTKHKTIH